MRVSPSRRLVLAHHQVIACVSIRADASEPLEVGGILYLDEVNAMVSIRADASEPLEALPSLKRRETCFNSR